MSELLERLKSALADRYAVDSEIGRGGMAAVFLADDLKHGRKVAIKVLHPELAATLGSERFLREIEIATKLTHPRVLPIFDSGASDGLLFYVMPFVEGDSLRDRLDREKQLPLDEALQIAEQVADVLAYAHDQGIVHRDIKPENILFEAGHAIVADFGIAKAIATAGGEKLTQTGMAVGTPAYMSPEQAVGEENVDGRADLYALSCVLYEMLAGDPPFTGATAQVILARKSTESVPGLRSARETVSEGVEAVIARALAKAPADRYPTARDFTEALKNPPQPSLSRARRRWALVFAALFSMLTLGWILLLSPSAGAVPVVAVLPCDNLSPDSEQVRAADRWADDLITDLFKTPQLHPRPWASMQGYRGADVSPAEIAAEQGADYFLTCGVDEGGDEVRFRAALVRTENEDLVWADDFRRDFSVAGMISLRSETVQEIARAVGAEVSGAQLEMLEQLPTQSDSAYKLYLRGRDAEQEALQVMGPESMRPSLEFYDQAIALDSTFALAYAAKAFSLDFHGQLARLAPRDYYPDAKRLLLRALDLDPSLGPASTMLGLVLVTDDWEWPVAESYFLRGIELEPENAFAHTYYAHGLSSTGRHQEAIAEMLKAVELEPTSVFHRSNLSWRYQFAGRHEEALEEAQRALALDSTDVFASMTLGVSLAALGRHAEAIQALDAGRPLSDSHLGWTYAKAGRRSEAEELLADLLQAADESYGDAVNIAMIYMGLDEYDEAIAWLGRAYDEHSIYITLVFGDLEWFPFEPLREDPRFQDLKARVGFGD